MVVGLVVSDYFATAVHEFALRVTAKNITTQGCVGTIMEESENAEFIRFEKHQTLAPVRVLSVDDKPQNLLAVEDILDAPGERIVSKSSGNEALKYLLTHDVAAILLDVRMPGMDGFETATLIRQRIKSKDTPIIFITAGIPTDAEVRNAYALGAVDYIAKPIVPEILKSKVSVFIELYRKTLTLKHKEREREILMDKLTQANTKLKEQSLIDQQKLIRLEKLSALGKFASLVGHEIRGPLGVIGNSASFINLRLSNTSDEKISKHVRIMGEEIQKSEGIISNILGFARTKRLETEPCCINSVISVLINDEIVPSNISIEQKLDSSLPQLSADVELLKRVFGNLLSNAVQAISGEGTIIVSTIFDAHRNQVMISFQDTGCGIPEEYINQVFDPLFTTKNTGTGLGLAASENIIHSHQGTISVQSIVDKGTTFNLAIPLLQDQGVAT